MLRFIIFLAALGCSSGSIYASKISAQYQIIDEPIDVIIPCIEKDLETLNLCIAGIRDNCAQVRRIIVVSSKPLTDQAEWFDERSFPFDKGSISLHLQKENATPVQEFFAQERAGWYFQQLLKFYSSFVIPDLSSNVLILDSDVIFLNPVIFLDSDLCGLYNVGSEYCPAYFEHANAFLPGLSRIYPDYSGICHHMLFQRTVLEDLFAEVAKNHQIPLWQAFCHCINQNEIFAGASEYEIYFNFVFSRTDQVRIRHLKWANIDRLDLLEECRSQGYHYVSCHSWLRKN